MAENDWSRWAARARSWRLTETYVTNETAPPASSFSNETDRRKETDRRSIAVMALAERGPQGQGLEVIEGATLRTPASRPGG